MTLENKQSTWCTSRSFDLFFLANLWWPAFLLPFVFSTDVSGRLEFWQLYFITAPHRWITLLLVAADPDRRGGRPGVFLGIPLLVLVIVIAVRLGTGTLMCLMLIDYVWNAWHFASQHFGIARIYSRRTGGSSDTPLRYLLRITVMYCILRLAAWTTGWSEIPQNGPLLISVLDFGVVLLITCMLLRETISLVNVWFRDREVEFPRRLPRSIYLISVESLYLSLLLAVITRQSLVAQSLAIASAAFHATEYLAIVSFYADRRKQQGSRGAFQKLATQWGSFLLLYVCLIGALGFWMDRRWAELWLGINVWAAFVHYWYDGMIWKLRRPETSKVLGAESSAAVGRVISPGLQSREPIGVGQER